MNPVIIIQVRPGAWRRALVEATLYAGVFVAVGYFARPIVERML